MMRRFLGLMVLSALSSPAYSAKVMLVRFQSDDMNTVAEVVKKDLKGHEVTEFIMKKETEYAEFFDAFKQQKPQLLALFDNKAVNFMKKMQAEKAIPEAEKAQAAATMALNLRYVLKDAQNICGIAYEVPAFTTVTRFRALNKKPLQHILAPYRKSEFEASFLEAKQQLDKENIKLLGVDVEKNGSNPEDINKMVASVLGDQYEGKKIDAILIPSDNLILNKEGFVNVWLAKARELKIPFICNIDKFASKEFDFCTFAAYPDFSDLGHQFAEQIGEILNNNTPASELGVDYIVAAKASLNMVRSKALQLPLNEEKLETVKVIE